MRTNSIEKDDILIYIHKKGGNLGEKDNFDCAIFCVVERYFACSCGYSQ